jgi:hypothetical protein
MAGMRRTSRRAMAAVLAAAMTLGAASPAMAASKPKVSKQAQRFIKAEGSEASVVQAEVEDVLTQLGIVIKDKGANQSDLVSLANLAQKVHDMLSSMHDDFIGASDGSGAIQNDEFNVSDGENGLKNSMGALVKFTGAPNAANEASFSTQYNNGLGQWNAGVKALWAAAAKKGAPVIP